MGGMRSPALLTLLVSALGSPAWAGNELTLGRAVGLAVRNNLEMAAERQDLGLAEMDREQAASSYGLALGVDAGMDQTMRPATSQFLTGQTRLTEARQHVDLSLKQRLPTGGSVKLGFNNGVFDTNSSRVDINPAVTPKITVDLSQPLMREAWSGWLQMDVAGLRAEQARLQVRERLMGLLADTESAYWDLLAERHGLDVLVRSRDGGAALVEATKAREIAGAVARLEVIQSEANLALKEAAVVDAERRVHAAEDRIRQLVDPAGLELAGTIVPSDKPKYDPRPLDLEVAQEQALKASPQHLRAVTEVRVREIEAQIAGRDRLPGVELTAQVGAESLDRQYGTAISSLSGLQNTSLLVGVGMDLPLTSSTREIAFRKARLKEQQAHIRAAAARTRLSYEVRQAVRNVESGVKRLKAAQMAGDLAARQLEAEVEKLNLGFSSNFSVITAQNSRDQASLEAIQALVTLLKADIDLRKLEGTLEKDIPLDMEVKR